MDFSNRVQHQTMGSGPAANPNPGASKKGSNFFNSKSWRVASVTLIFAIALLVVASALLMVFNGGGESGYVNSSEFQAVDINVAGNSSDQIYFGNIKTINDRYVVLRNVYYIPQSSSSSSITLQPLVCLVDKPENQMVINRNSVNWWENLQSSGKVAQALNNYQQHPTGCTSSSSSASPSSSSSNTSSSNTPKTSTTSPGSTSTTNTTKTTTTKP